MRKSYLFLLILVAIGAGCGRKKVAQERICSRIDFERIVSLFPKTVPEVHALTQKSKNDMDLAIELIGDISGCDRTYQNTALAYEQAYFQFFLNAHVLNVLAAASCDAELQAEAYRAVADLGLYKNNVLSRNVTLYQAFGEYQKLGKDTYRKTPSVHYFLHDVMQRFEKEGMKLPVAKRDDLVDLEKEIQDLSSRFESNVSRSASSMVVPQKELYGVSDQSLSSLSKDSNGNYILPVNYPTFCMIMQNCLVESTRKTYFMLFGQQGYPANQTILEALISKRNQYAQMLGYKDFATYQLDDLMAKTPKKAEDFLWKMVKGLQPYEDKDFKELTQHLPPSVQFVGTNQLKPWDQALVKSSYRKKHFDFSDDKISEYFSLDTVIPALLQQFSQFFHIEFEHQKAENMWAQDLLCYRVRSLKNQSVIGYIFLDLYKRPLKKITGPCYMMIIPAIRDDCSISCVGSSVVIADFEKPTQCKPTLLKLHEVVSLFHEMGHAVHALFGATRFTQFSGTQVAKDFEHAPSQMLEHWFDQPEVVHAVSRHYQTGAPLSKGMIEKIIASQKFDRADKTLKQSFLGLISLNLFKQNNEKDIHSMIEKMHKKLFKHVAYEQGCYFETSFMALAHDCGAACYMYPWSRVLAADLFAHVKTQGLANHEMGIRYVSEILSPGGSKNPHDMVKRFLGRSWNSHAFFESL
ncbi:MAG: M3 family metallopeptidase [Candidatus Dependentiae bacterium]|nr:M3 family metallopeptidase [Candidatus Dependentiae bacterium]